MSQTKGLIYKNKPLVRCGDKIYYGDPADKYIVCLTVESKKPYQDLELPEDVQIQVISTDPNVSKRKRIVKTGTKKGRFVSIDIAEAWLKRYLRGNE